MMTSVMYEGVIQHLKGEALRAITPLTDSVIVLVATAVRDLINPWSFIDKELID